MIAASAVAVAVTAAAQATVGVTYTEGAPLACSAGGVTSGWIACEGAAIVTGRLRTSAAGGAHVVLAAQTAGDALAVTCSGGIVGAPRFAGTASAPAQAASLATPQACMSWTGPVVAEYQLVVTFAADAARIDDDAPLYAAFTAVATAN